MKITIDQDKCIGCGRCTEICSNTFKLNTNGKSEVINNGKSDCAMKSADECPVEAIFVEE
ncbi:MAG: ferredoxin [Patescibacteria group bacterium]|nr:ferredoxin [Patescibacteria group bacterium]